MQINILTSFCCKICAKDHKNAMALSQHLKAHKHNMKSYILEFFLNNEIPKCSCGCGNDVTLKNHIYSEYLVGHNPNCFWQNKLDPESAEYKSIVAKISKSVTKSHIENPREFTDETRKKISDANIKWMQDNPELQEARIKKMTETKVRQSENGTLVRRHYTKNRTAAEVDDIYFRIGSKSSETKKRKFKSGELIPWPEGLTAETDDRIAKRSGENNYRYNPNKEDRYTKNFRNVEYRRQILESQNGKCLYCEKEKSGMCLHHVDENKMNDGFDNLVFVCRSCHIRIHNAPKLNEQFKIKVSKFKESLNIIFVKNLKRKNKKWVI